jgi:hypothetical protein
MWWRKDRRDAFGRPVEEAAPAAEQERGYPGADFPTAPLGSRWAVPEDATLRAIAVWEVTPESDFGRTEYALALMDAPDDDDVPYQWVCSWDPEETPGEEIPDILRQVRGADPAPWREAIAEAVRIVDGGWPADAKGPPVTVPGGGERRAIVERLAPKRLEGPLPAGLREVALQATFVNWVDRPEDDAPARWFLCTAGGEPLIAFVEAG